MSWLSKGLSKVGDFFEDSSDWLPMVGGALLSAVGMPYLGIPLAGIGAGVGNYQKSGDWGSALLSGAGSAAGAYGGGRLLSGAYQGWNAAAGQALPQRLWNTGSGALWGTGSTAAPSTVAGGGYMPVQFQNAGLFGSGSLLSGGTLRNLGTLNSGMSLLGGFMGGGQPPITIQPYYPSGSSGYYPRNYGTSSGGATNFLYGAPGSSTTGVDAATLNDRFQQVKKQQQALTWQFPKPWGVAQ